MGEATLDKASACGTGGPDGCIPSTARMSKGLSAVLCRRQKLSSSLTVAVGPHSLVVACLALSSQQRTRERSGSA